jgi:hypothetical protein
MRWMWRRGQDQPTGIGPVIARQVSGSHDNEAVSDDQAVPGVVWKVPAHPLPPHLRCASAQPVAFRRATQWRADKVVYSDDHEDLGNAIDRVHTIAAQILNGFGRLYW